MRQTVRKQGNLGLIVPGQSGKMKSGSDFDVDADAPSLSVGKNNGTAVQTGKKPPLKPGQYDEVITWGAQTIQARREGAGDWGTRVKQKNPRVDAYERKINPHDESYYLPKPGGGFAQFENVVGIRVQDGKMIMSPKSYYHTYDMKPFAEIGVILQAERQLQAADYNGYQVEWLVSDEKAAEQLQRLFKEKNMHIIVTYMPE